MRLIVLACDSATPPSEPQSWVLRLVGMPRADETPPPDTLRAADEAAAQVRATFPRWLWQWVCVNGALELQVWPGPISWWWLTPLSEKSPLRSPLIRELYWLTLLHVVLQTHSIETVEWHGDDALLAATVLELGQQCGVTIVTHVDESRRRWALARALVFRARYFFSQALCWMLLRTLRFGRRSAVDAQPDVLLYSRFPILWEDRGARWHERMFGNWPDTLAANGHHVDYAAVFSGTPLQLVREWRTLRDRCKQQRVWLLHTTVSFFEMLRAHLSVRILWRYVRWRAVHRRLTVRYDGLDVSALFWRELDANALSAEIPFNLATAAGLRALLARLPAVRALFLPFEYQPMERAVWMGVTQSRNVAVVGLQTGLYTSNQMGFAFPAEEIAAQPDERLRAPVPDVLAAYGELPYRIFSERVGAERVCLSGPIRYPYLGGNADDVEAFRRALALSPAVVPILVATSSAREESLPLLEAAFRLAGEHVQTFLLLKFHYHLPLHTEAARLAADCGHDRYRVFETDLPLLMRVAPMMLCAGSSTGIEALALGCMPLVFRSPGEMSANPMLDVPDAVFFWGTLTELRTAWHECLTRSEAYERHRAAWPRAVAEHLFRLDGGAEARLYQFLRNRRIL